uniref:Uncharacterized protein n=1 Tax=Salix viminalis TaxID=40686 RepID=A0A6N2MZX6_SALVM
MSDKWSTSPRNVRASRKKELAFWFCHIAILCHWESLLHYLNGIWFGEYRLRANLARHDMNLRTARVIPKIVKLVTPKTVTIKERNTRSYAMVVSSPAWSNNSMAFVSWGLLNLSSLSNQRVP